MNCLICYDVKEKNLHCFTDGEMKLKSNPTSAQKVCNYIYYITIRPRPNTNNTQYNECKQIAYLTTESRYRWPEPMTCQSGQ